MAIILKTETSGLRQFKSTHFYYAVTYIIITFFVLLFLNIYCSRISQDVFRSSKQTAMIEKCLLAANEIEKLEVVNSTTVSEAVNQLGSLKVGRIIVVDQDGIAIYDSFTKESALGKCILLPEIAKAMQNQDVFTWSLANKVTTSCVATPILSFGKISGCVYMSEQDVEQGALLDSLQRNIFTITLILELAVIIFSFFFSSTITKRLRKLMKSMRIIREGDYTHKVSLGGNDELTVLGDEFNELTQKLHASEERRRQFVSDASHELKTPLASIKLLTDSILQNEMDMDTIHEFVEDIGNEAERLNRMSQKLLSLSYVESQDDHPYEIVYIAPTAKKVVRMLSANAKENNIEIITHLEDDSTILVMEDDLYQIIFNLTENGIKYNKPNGKLELLLKRDGDNAVLTVRDTGVGIPEASIGHIFERFYRVDKARARKTGGSGLGLSIVKTLVERNKGEIFAESSLGEGTTITISFPVFDTEETK